MDPYVRRNDIPLLEGTGPVGPVVYFDNACMTLRPKSVIAKLMEYYNEYPGCGGRSIHRISTRVNDEFEKAREEVARFVNAYDVKDVIFTKNTTEAINIVSHSFPFKKGDRVLGTDHEHNSNLVPWVYLMKKGAVRYEHVPSNDENELDMDMFRQMVKGARLVSMVHVSNLDGSRIPEKEVIEIAHDNGAMVMLDCAQSVPHCPVDMKGWDLDLLAFSGHKVCGPSGTGALVGKPEAIEMLDPFIIGGDTVKETRYDHVEFLGPPKRFEAGLQDYGGLIGLGEALRYVRNVGLSEVHDHEVELNRYAANLLQGMVRTIGPKDPAKRGGIFPFLAEPLNSHDIAIMLDETAGIAIRSGLHCVHSWFNGRNEKASARASFYLYNTKEEVKLFAETLSTIIKDLA